MTTDVSSLYCNADLEPSHLPGPPPINLHRCAHAGPPPSTPRPTRCTLPLSVPPVVPKTRWQLFTPSQHPWRLSSRPAHDLLRQCHLEHLWRNLQHRLCPLVHLPMSNLGRRVLCPTWTRSSRRHHLLRNGLPLTPLQTHHLSTVAAATSDRRLSRSTWQTRRRLLFVLVRRSPSHLPPPRPRQPRRYHLSPLCSIPSWRVWQRTRGIPRPIPLLPRSRCSCPSRSTQTITPSMERQSSNSRLAKGRDRADTWPMILQPPTLSPPAHPEIPLHRQIIQRNPPIQSYQLHMHTCCSLDPSLRSSLEYNF